MDMVRTIPAGAGAERYIGNGSSVEHASGPAEAKMILLIRPRSRCGSTSTRCTIRLRAHGSVSLCVVRMARLPCSGFDDGAGMATGDLERVCNRFHRGAGAKGRGGVLRVVHCIVCRGAARGGARPIF